MPTSDPLTILLHHDRWATEALLDACDALDEAQFHREFEMGCGSLHDTLVHMLGAMKAWGDLLAGRPPSPRAEARRWERSELRTGITEAADSLEQSAAAGALSETSTPERGGQRFTFARGAVLTHITTHSMHHRAQALNMLRHLGVDPLPMSSVLEWTNTVDCPPVPVED